MLLIAAIVAGELIKFSFGLKVGINNGLTTLDIVVIIISAIGLVKIKFNLLKIPFWGKAPSIFMIIALASLLLTPLTLNFTERLVSFGYIFRLGSYILLGLVLYKGAFKEISIQMNNIFIISGTFLSLLGLLQLFFVPSISFLSAEGWDPHYLRTVSTFLDPNFLGVFLVLSLLSLISVIKKPLQQKTLLLCFFVIYLALITTFSRTALLTLTTSLIIFSLLKKSTQLLVLTLILCLGMVASYQIYNKIVAAPHHIDRQQSAQYRVSSWQVGLKMWQQSPILGVGFNSYRYALREYKLMPLGIIEGHGGTTNDSSLIFVLATTGVLGLFFYLTFLISLIFTAFKSRRFTLRAVYLSGLCGLFVGSFFTNLLFYPWMLLWISIYPSHLKSE